MKKAILLIGAPGSGKSTQAKFIVEEKKYTHYIQSSFLKEESKTNKTISDLMNNGKLVPNDLCKEVFEKYFNFEEKILLDGYPRTSFQNGHIKEFLAKNEYEYVIVFLEILEEDVVNRIKKRKEIENRADDDINIFKVRFETYQNETIKSLYGDFDNSKIIKINANQKIEDIKNQLFLELDKINF